MAARIIRPLHGRIEIHGLRAPTGGEPPNRKMLQAAAGKAIRPAWIVGPDEPGWKGHWAIARGHLTAVAEAIAIRDGLVSIEMHYSALEQCDRRCQSAESDDCTCSCEGRHHGQGQHAKWVDVGATTLVQKGEEKIVVRELSRKQALAGQMTR